MKHLHFLNSILLSSLLVTSFIACGQEEPILTNTKKTELIHKIADSLAHYYIDEEDAVEIGNFLKNRSYESAYDSINQPMEFAQFVTNDLRQYNGDKHLSLRYMPPSDDFFVPFPVAPKRNSNYGISKVEILPENIGYLKINEFSFNDQEGTKAISSAVGMMQNTDALIIDVRDNPGGSARMISFLISHFFEGDPVHLTHIKQRYTNSSFDIYTERNIPGKKLPDLPIYVLVNENTGSAAEAFSYWLKNLERAKIIGTNTAGAGNMVSSRRIDNMFTLYVSTGEEVNPITKSNFEGVGVEPNVIISNDQDAFNVALNLALEDQQQKVTLHQSLTEELKQQWSSISPTTPIHEVLTILKSCHGNHLIGQDDINSIGYHFLTQWNDAPKAEKIFELNVAFYPNEPNVYDSYGEALEANGKPDQAAINFTKAYRLGVSSDSPYNDYFKSNVERYQKPNKKPLKEEETIRSVLEEYINGTQVSDPKLLQYAFHKDLNLYSINDRGMLSVLAGSEYISYFADGRPRNRTGKIISIDYENDIAMAKIEVDMPEKQRLYTDYLMLLKINGQWSIIHKSFTYKDY